MLCYYGSRGEECEILCGVTCFVIVGVRVKECGGGARLNIQKAIDQMVRGVKILGCFFHLTKTFYKKVQTKGMATRYDEDILFQKFV